MYLADVTIRIEETLDKDRVRQIEHLLCAEHGIANAWVQDKSRHLLMVEFDAEEVEPSALIRSIRRKGLHAKTFGL
jgi:hypothetical protein